jgi:hypothetical protein
VISRRKAKTPRRQKRSKISNRKRLLKRNPEPS